MMILYTFILAAFLQSVSGLERETIKSSVRVGKNSFSCTFSLAWSGTTVVAKESKLTCKGKKKKVKLTDYRLEGRAGVFQLDFSIIPTKIRRGVFEPSVAPTTTSAPEGPPSPTSCELGYTRVCIQDPQSPCSQGSVPHCFGSSPSQGTRSSSQEEVSSSCTCLATWLVEAAIRDGVSPLGACHQGCVCIEDSCPTPPTTDQAVLVIIGDQLGWIELLGERCQMNSSNLPLRGEQQALLTPDNLPLVCGGYGRASGCERFCDKRVQSSCSLFNTTSMTWGDYGSLVRPRNRGAAVVVGDNSYILGGSGWTSADTPNNEYTSKMRSPATIASHGSKFWGPGPSIPGPGFHGGCAVALNNDSFLMITGATYSQNRDNGFQVRRYNVKADKWTLIRDNFTLYSDGLGSQTGVCGYFEGQVILTSERTGRLADAGASWVLDVTTGQTRRVGDLQMSRKNQKMLVFNGRLLLVGGDNPFSYTVDIEEWQPESETWTNNTISLAWNRYRTRMVTALVPLPGKVQDYLPSCTPITKPYND